MKRVKPVRNAAVVVRVFPEERDILRFNAALHGMRLNITLEGGGPDEHRESAV